ncbi:MULTISPECIES: ABC transporter permease [unclassified Synechocystis]|uniref:ABC transporter permease n=1 Tax=unclassified Synechocystis TaxID=2640012 RepID=UPI00041BDE4F|nr:MULTISPECIES: ABC transporter permease [unclassified Synechocystis]AIE75493.1 Oligopeptide transport system permease protein OppC [Synechocystis sp. PCC 6714]MCT0253708.1 ABC transporter permease [Synechocystis sp. CS-94]
MTKTVSLPSQNIVIDLQRKIFQRPLASLSLIALIIIVLAVILGPIFYRVPIDQIDFTQTAAPPSWQHPLGTNDLGQDQLARLLIGGRISLAVGLSAMGVSLTLGTLIGAIAGYFGGWWDMILMRITELFLALPQLPLVLLVVYLFREPVTRATSPEKGIFILVVLLIGLLNWMSVARLVRGNILRLREMEFVKAAIAMGASSSHIIWRHLLPNVLNLIIVAASLAVGNAIITESTLSFLGLGFPPDVPTWGQMLYTAKDYLETSPLMAVFPGLAIFITVLSVNYLGDGIGVKNS